MIKLKTEKSFFLLLIMMAVGFWLSLPQLQKPMIAEADAYSRTNIIFARLEDGLFFNKYGGTWLPLYSSLMILISSYFNDPWFTPRAVTLVISLASVLVMYFFSAAFTQDKKAALISAAIFLFLPIRIFLSTQTLTEPVFIFFLIFSLFFIAEKKPRWWQLMLSLLLLNLAHGIRYESWLLLPLIWLFIILKPLKFKNKLSYIILSLIFPMCWIYLNHKHFGSAWAFFQIKHEVAQRQIIPQYFNLKLSWLAWQKKLLPLFPKFFLIISSLSLIKLFKQKNLKQLFLHLLPIYLYILLIVQVYFGTMEWFPHRYLLIPLAFFTPLMAQGFIFIFDKFKTLLNKFSSRKLLPLFELSLMIITGIVYFRSLRQTQAEITTNSLLQTYEKNLPLETSPLYQDFVQLIHYCDQSCTKPIIYLHQKHHRSDLAEALFYFTREHGYDLDQNVIDLFTTGKLPEEVEMQDSFLLEILNDKGLVIVWEKGQIKIGDKLKNFEKVYENDSFLIVRVRPYQKSI